MKNIICIFFLFSFSFGFAQDTIYLNKDWKETLDTDKAAYYEVFVHDPSNPDKVEKRTYFISGQIKAEEFYTSYKKLQREGQKRTWKEDGKIHSITNFKNGKWDGFFMTFWENGQLKRKDTFKKGKFKEGKTWDSLGNPVEYYPLEERAKYPGGKKALVEYLKKNIKKPAGAGGGKVVVGFVIDVDGSITDVQVEESSSPALNYAAYQVVADMPKWEPGKQDGETVKVKYSLPIIFSE